MANYKLSNSAKEDLIRIHHHGVKKLRAIHADKYFESFFEYFDIIDQKPFSFESIDHIKDGYSRFTCGADSIYYKVNNGNVEIIAVIGIKDLKYLL
jgi:toxin ParE1/3/4